MSWRRGEGQDETRSCLCVLPAVHVAYLHGFVVWQPDDWCPKAKRLFSSTFFACCCSPSLLSSTNDNATQIHMGTHVWQGVGYLPLLL